MASIWDKFESSFENFQDWLFPPPETGYSSPADSVRWDRLKRTPLENKNESPFADNIKFAAWDLIGTDTFLRDGGTDMTCATAACQIFNQAKVPWPEDKSGNAVESIDYVIDAFDGRGNPGKLFAEHSGDFKPVGPGELAKGDMLILDMAYGGTHLNEESQNPGWNYQKHMAIITDIYDSGIEIVHDRGVGEPKTSKFFPFTWLYGNENDKGYFDRAYRYIPNINNSAFKHLVYNSQ
mgnify:CR=1 FL=1